ncbi:MAG: MGH1-like glycoside hydrolase domain-containing protein, partial [Bacteroidales bacterium]
MEECIGEPVKYTGSIQPTTDLYDGRLPHAAGVQHYQVYRANRSEPLATLPVGRTYNHQPYLAYWNGRFYLQFLSGEYQEHTPPACICLTTSEDGMNWETPEVLFPDYSLPEIKGDGYTIPAGTMAVMHQRMGFYVTTSGKLLASGFYGYCATPRNSPNAGNGLGRVIREIREDGSFGPVYFIRYNRHAGWNESNTSFPFYRESKDMEFVEACEELLNNKLVTLQWWEEDRAKDGFYTIDPADVSGATFFDANVVTSAGAGKALSTYHRPDGVVVGLWKNQFAALSDDEGQSWSPIGKNPTLWTTGAKTWGQRTEDGRYVIVHNQSATRRNRFPMTALVGDDGHEFYDILCLNGQVAPKRYHGIHKNVGTQYFRGISEGNGDPPGSDAWFVYSMNKEDIWITRAVTPLSGTVRDQVDQDFDGAGQISDLEMWNVYRP